MIKYFVIRNFRGTYSSFEMLRGTCLYFKMLKGYMLICGMSKGYMAKERLGTPGLERRRRKPTFRVGEVLKIYVGSMRKQAAK